MKNFALALLAGILAQSANGNEVVKQAMKESRERRAMERSFSRPASVKNAPSTCTGGFAAAEGLEFPCKDVDFLSFISSEELYIDNGPGIDSADIWGWLSPSGQEITLLGMVNGVAVIDSTDSVNPCIIAKLPTTRAPDLWADVKVYGNVMYEVHDRSVNFEFDESAQIGVEVYNLLQFDGVDCHAPGYEPAVVLPTNVLSEHGRAHNVLINNDSGRLYTVGTQSNKCSSGFHVWDLNTDLIEPEFLGCIGGDGYTHDAQCVTYDGPDANFQGKEICLAFNEDTLTIWDATELPATMLARKFYPNQAYSHQGWFTRDLKHVLLDDELDELCNGDPAPSYCSSLVAGELTGVHTTSTSVFDVTNLTAPVLVTQLVWDTVSIDHNLYCWGCIHEKGWGGNAALEYFPDPNYIYMSNYMSGVRIVDVHSEDPTEWFETAFFDILPEEDAIDFAGAWSTYMHPSGVLAVSSIETGVFFLQPRTAFSEEFPAPPPGTTSSPTTTPPPTPGTTSTGSPTTGTTLPPAPGGSDTVALILVVVAIVILVIAIILLATAGKKTTATSQVRAVEAKAVAV